MADCEVGFKVLISHVYDPNDPHIYADPQFRRHEGASGDYARHEEPHPSDPAIRAPWYSLDYPM